MPETLTGIAFPFRILGGVARSSDAAKVESDVLQLVGTRVGERIMLRSYGGGVHHRLQEGNDSTLRALIKHDIEQGLRTFMPEVQLTAPLRVAGGEDELRITILYRADPLDVVRRLEIRLP